MKPKIAGDDAEDRDPMTESSERETEGDDRIRRNLEIDEDSMAEDGSVGRRCGVVVMRQWKEVWIEVWRGDI